MTRKIVVYAFNGEVMCFMHALLNVLDMKQKEFDVKLVIEGSATKQIKESQGENSPIAQLYETVKSAGLIDCVCKACSNKMGSLEDAKEQGLPICDDMSGHPSMSKYIDEGYEIIVI